MTPSKSVLTLFQQFTAGALLIVATNALIYSPAQAEELPLLDCGPLWTEEAQARIRMTVDAGMFDHSNTVARYPVDFRTFGNKSDPRKLDATVLRCEPSAEGGRLVPIPCRVTKQANGTAVVEWRLPGTFPPFSKERIHIYLSRKGTLQKPSTDKTPWPKSTPDNLIPNPGFETIDDADTRNAAGWFLSGEKKTKPFLSRAEHTTQATQNGTRGIRLTVHGPDGNSNSISPPRVTGADPIPLKEGTTYHVMTHAHIRSASGIGLRVEVRFQDATGKRTGDPLILESPSGHTTSSFQSFGAFGKAPKGTIQGQIVMTTRGNKGVTDVDFLQLRPHHLERTPVPQYLVNPLEEKAEEAKQWTPEEPGKAILLDLGPPTSSQTAGFLPLHPQSVLQTEGGAGWKEQGVLEAFADQRPGALSQDGIYLKDTPLQIRTNEEEVLVWLLMGRYKTEPEKTEPENTSYTLQIGNQEVVLSPPPHQAQGTYHTERNDDAVQELRNRKRSIFSSYILPHFTQLVTKAIPRDGVVEIACAQGKSCPLVAAGLFAGVSEERVKTAISTLHSQRRKAFEDRWAQRSTEKIQKQKFPSTKSEQERGFVPFIPEEGVPVSPTLMPERANVVAAMNGLTLVGFPGDVLHRRIGVFPLKFRRGGKLQVTEPITSTGVVLSSSPLVLRTTRYRALRSSTQHYSLEADTVEESTSVEVRPGITRTVWVSIPIDAQTKPGNYRGAIRISTGRERFVEMPLRIEVLPASYATEAIAQGVTIETPKDLALLPNKNVKAVTFPIDRATPKDLIPALEELLKEASSQNIPLSRVFLRSDKPLKKESLTDWETMLVLLRETAVSRGWPEISLLMPSFKKGGMPAKMIRGLCGAKGWKCAGTLLSDRPRKRDRSENIGLIGRASAIPQVQPKATRRKPRKGQETWLKNVGCGRFGRGLLPWAYKLDGVLCDGILPADFPGDALDAWTRPPRWGWESYSSTRRQLLSERALFAAQGIQDVRLLKALASRAQAAPKKSQKAKEALNLLKEIRQEVLDTRLNFSKGKITTHWPYPDLREAIVEHLLQLEDPL